MRRQSESFKETEVRAGDLSVGLCRARKGGSAGHAVSPVLSSRGASEPSPASQCWAVPPRLGGSPALLPSLLPQRQRGGGWRCVVAGGRSALASLPAVPLLSAAGRPPRSRPCLPPHPAPSAAAPADPPTPRAFPLCGDRRETLFLSHEQLSPRENPTVGLGDLRCTVCA